MTTDDFTTATRAEADRRMRADGLATQAAMVRARGFAEGAEWARDHLAAQEPTHKTVLDHWDEQERARAALFAARKARS